MKTPRGARFLAKHRGELTYTGKPCINCTATERYVLNKGCIWCVKQRAEGQYKPRDGRLKETRDKLMEGVNYGLGRHDPGRTQANRVRPLG